MLEDPSKIQQTKWWKLLGCIFLKSLVCLKYLLEKEKCPQSSCILKKIFTVDYIQRKRSHFWFNSVCCCSWYLTGFGWTWLGVVGFGWAWLVLVGLGWIWLGLVGFGWVWLGLVGFGKRYSWELKSQIDLILQKEWAFFTCVSFATPL